MPESAITYKGGVAIKLNDKPSVRAHNEGTYHLFNLVNRIFSKTLIDLTDLGQRLPAYISLIYEDERATEDNLRTNPDYTEYSKNCLLIKELPIVSKEIIDETILYRSLLTSSVLDGSMPVNIDRGFALLLDSSCKDIIAFSSIELHTLKEIYETKLSQSEIEWKMSFSNSSEEVK